MKWRKVTVTTTVAAEDIVSMMLMELGVEGVQIENNVPLSEEDTEKMFIDILPELPPDDGTSRLSFYIHEFDPQEEHRPVVTEGVVDNSYAIDDRIWTDEEFSDLLDSIRESLEGLREFTDIGEGTIEIGESEDTDWRDKWKQFFQPILIDKILIIPSWLEIPEEYKEDVESGELRTVVIDPGVAFGTGSHETTKLCIPELIRTVKEGSRVLDLGTGSGILGMAASKLGADLVTAVDIDPACEEVLRENIAMNGIPEENFRIITGNVLSEDGTSGRILSELPENTRYDVAVANILAPVIIALAAEGAADRFVKKGGSFITSGILDQYEEDVLRAFRENTAWEEPAVTRMNEWVCITAVRK